MISPACSLLAVVPGLFPPSTAPSPLVCDRAPITTRLITTRLITGRTTRGLSGCAQAGREPYRDHLGGRGFRVLREGGANFSDRICPAAGAGSGALNWAHAFRNEGEKQGASPLEARFCSPRGGDLAPDVPGRIENEALPSLAPGELWGGVEDSD